MESHNAQPALTGQNGKANVNVNWIITATI